MNEKAVAVPGVELLRIEDVVRRTRLSRATIYNLVMRGELQSITIGRSRRIPAEALRQFVEARVEAAS